MKKEKFFGLLDSLLRENPDNVEIPDCWYRQEAERISRELQARIAQGELSEEECRAGLQELGGELDDSDLEQVSGGCGETPNVLADLIMRYWNQK